MPRYLPNLRFSDCWSSIGNVTFFHIDGRCYWRTRPHPVFPGTPGQLQQLDIHRRALAAWRNISSEEQRQWNFYALDVPSNRPPYDSEHHITGHNLFVSAYHGFAQLGNEHTPVPVPYPDFPVATVQSVTASRVNGNDLQLECSVLMKSDTPPSRFRVAARIQLAEIDEGRNAGKMRSCLSDTVEIRTLQDGNGTGTFEMIIRFSPYALRSIAIPEGNRMNMYSRFFLIDQVTGYRKMVMRDSRILVVNG